MAESSATLGGTFAFDLHSMEMSRQLYIGLAALAGTIILFVLWLAQYEQHAAIERIER